MPLYFAYGSNMDHAQMRERCPESTLVGKAVLEDYKIGFTIFSPKRQCGCADVLNSPGSEVWGLLYDVSESDLLNLDKAEMHPDKYRRFSAVVEDETGKKYTAEVYKVATREGEFLKPSKHYLGLLTTAAKAFAFPETYQKPLAEVPTLD